jgi:hypothetical protein
VHRLVAEAASAGARALVVDLRDNLGGSFDAVVAVAGAFEASCGRLFAGPMVGFGLRCDDGVLRVVDPFGRVRPAPASRSRSSSRAPTWPRG